MKKSLCKNTYGSLDKIELESASPLELVFVHVRARRFLERYQIFITEEEKNLFLDKISASTKRLDEMSFEAMKKRYNAVMSKKESDHTKVEKLFVYYVQNEYVHNPELTELLDELETSDDFDLMDSVTIGGLAEDVKNALKLKNLPFERDALLLYQENIELARAAIFTREEAKAMAHEEAMRGC